MENILLLHNLFAYCVDMGITFKMINGSLQADFVGVDNNFYRVVCTKKTVSIRNELVGKSRRFIMGKDNDKLINYIKSLVE